MSELDPKRGAGPSDTALDPHSNDAMKSLSDAGGVSPRGRRRAISMWDRELVRRSLRESLRKLDPRALAHNPVMFVVEIGSVFTTIDAIRYLISGHFGMFSFTGQITIWLWLTVLFANFAEAMAEGRGQAHADELRRTRSETEARKVTATGIELVSATSLVPGDIVVVSAGEVIPGDGEVIEGIASVDESAITGESAPVIRESGGDRSAVTGGTTVLSDEIRVQITAGRGESFLDRMITLIEAGVRQKTPNEIALALLLAGLTLIFLVVVITLAPFSVYSHAVVSVTVLIALLVALIPTTIGGLLSAIGISGMNRLLEHNVLALSGRAVEAAGDVNVIMLDKTGTLTMGSRQATSFVPSPGIDERRLAEAAQLSSLADETPEGRSIVALANEKFGIQTPNLDSNDVEFVPFTAQTRMSGVDLDGRRIRKGATESVARWAEVELDPQTTAAIERIARAGSTPLLVAEDHQILGAVELKDVVKGSSFPIQVIIYSLYIFHHCSEGC